MGVITGLGVDGCKGLGLFILRTCGAGVLRPDITVSDVALLFEQLASVKLGDHERTEQLRHRYLALVLDSLRLPPDRRPLPGPPPEDAELRVRWTPRSA